MSRREKYRSGNLEDIRIEHRAPVLYSNGSTLRARMAGPSPDSVAGRRSSLSDASVHLAEGEISRDLGGGVVATRAPGGGFSLSSGGLHRALARADIDARILNKKPD